ncbi:MAG: proline--tRNA ligase [Bacilli bacterium]|nr:proline--tRNA ligase [Bacilli bacterium]
MDIKNEKITSRDQDFAQWYTDVCKKAELMDYSSTKGFIIYRPYGYAIWEEIQKYLDAKFKETGHENVYMPLVIPESLFNKEKAHVKGFAPETLIATIGGKEEIVDKLIIRPTSECVFTDFYSRIISSYRDLPKLYNQWCSVVRWEKTTRPFLRGSEFLWQEGHTMHASDKEAQEETTRMLEIYYKMGQELLAIPFMKGQKSEKEKFAGAIATYSIEALMHDGKALQCGTSHYFGQGFSKAFNVRYLDKDNQTKFPYQTSWGVSTRLIGALIMVHGDDNGLVLPPMVAPIQVVIVPIKGDQQIVQDKVKLYEDALKKNGVRVKVDNSDHTPGWKFAEWEMKGVPLRLEVGPKDIEKGLVMLAKRNDMKKLQVKESDVVNEVKKTLKTIQDEMYANALKHLKANIKEANSLDELKKIVDVGGYAKVVWCGEEECENKVKELTTATLRCIDVEKVESGTCAICGKKGKYIAYFAKAY